MNINEYFPQRIESENRQSWTLLYRDCLKRNVEIYITAVENKSIKISIFIKINIDKIQKKAANNNTAERKETVDHIIGE